MVNLTADDISAIKELSELYGHIIDNREWERADRLFTHDVVYDATDFGYEVAQGLDAVKSLWINAKQPVAHHATNIVVDVEGDVVAVRSKGLGIGRKGQVGSFEYRDIVRKEPEGWRIARRICTLRRPHPKPVD